MRVRMRVRMQFAVLRVIYLTLTERGFLFFMSAAVSSQCLQRDGMNVVSVEFEQGGMTRNEMLP